MLIERIWAMPNRWTFTIPPIKRLLDKEMNNGTWIDAFAGMNSPAHITNDLNPSMPVDYHMDALEFLKTQPSSSADGILHDPPYSITQAAECYNGYGKDLLGIHPSSMKYWSECKNEMARILKTDGKAICFGWNSMGLGKNRGFTMKRILLVPHGGSKNDTIITVEIKTQSSLEDYSTFKME